MPPWLSPRSRNRGLVFAVLPWPLPLAAWLAHDSVSLSLDYWLCYSALRVVATELCRVSSIDQRLITLKDVPRIALSVAGGSLAYGLLDWTALRVLLIDAALSLLSLLAVCSSAAWRRDKPLDQTPTLLEIGDVTDGRCTVRGPAELQREFQRRGTARFPPRQSRDDGRWDSSCWHPRGPAAGSGRNRRASPGTA